MRKGRAGERGEKREREMGHKLCDDYYQSIGAPEYSCDDHYPKHLLVIYATRTK
jgi:hypothetical protein